jgi:DNA-binding response OmpR family regulator
MKVLLVDDDTDLVELLEYALRRAGYTVLTALDGDRALSTWEAEDPDMVILDVVLPRVDGLEICRRIRERARTPIILLTERTAEADVLRGFESGADDYMPKPFSTKQLIARMRTIMCRYENDPARLMSKQLRAGELVFDPETHCVSKAGQPTQPVTRLEFNVLYHLALNAGQVVPYSRLIEVAWGYYGEASPSLLKTHISHVRRKLGLPQRGPGSVGAVLGIGYRMVKA